MTTQPLSKWLHEPFARFFEEPTRASLKRLLDESGGEFEQFDFKAIWPERDSLARHILAVANSGGGCLIVGVLEQEDGSLEPVGLPALTDKADIINGIKKYIPDSLLPFVRIVDFPYGNSENHKLAGKSFQVAFVEWQPSLLPFVSSADGASIRANAIYVRRGTSSEEANHSELQTLLGKRLEATSGTQRARDLKEHLSDLKTLYAEIPRSHSSGPQFSLSPEILRMAKEIFGTSTPNPKFPAEDYQDFILRVLDQKKRLIERSLGLP